MQAMLQKDNPTTAASLFHFGHKPCVHQNSAPKDSAAAQNTENLKASFLKSLNHLKSPILI